MNKKLNLTLGIFLLVLTFTIVSSVSYCCEKILEDGASCQQAQEITGCDRTTTCGIEGDFHECKVAPTSCESTSYCKTGTCVNFAQGECSPNSPLAKCELNGGNWKAESINSLVECQLGCCILGDDTALLTQIKCKQQSSTAGLETNFHGEINNWEECSALSNPDVMGACVFDEEYQKTCKMLTKRECQEFEGSSLGTNVEFNEGLLCSNKDLGTICGMGEQTICYEDRVHFIDTCGELANVYDYNEMKKQSYWDKIISPEDSCKISEDGVEKCGNSGYYETSSVCKAEKMGGPQAIAGDYVSSPLYCLDKGVKHEHGDSWCISNAIEGQENSPGARYAYLSCYDGEISSTECSEFRQEICIENKTSSRSYANCIENKWKDCNEQFTENDCINTDVRNCQWTNVTWYNPEDYREFDVWFQNVGSFQATPSNLNEFIEPDPSIFLGKGYCSPINSTGFKFWESSEEELNICLNNSYDCHVVWVEIWDPINSIKTKDGQNKFLESGFECLNVSGEIKSDWLNEMNKKCSLSGDCGLSNNFLNKGGHSNQLINFVERPEEEVGEWYIETAETSFASLWRTPMAAIGNLLRVRKITETVTFNCEPWQAPRGGENCEVCNQQDIPCTEYQCHSLGQGCDTINDEEGNLFCYHNNQNEPVPPVITLIKDLPAGFEFSDSEASSPPDLGVNLIHPALNSGNENPTLTKNCIPAYTPFDIKIHTSELANCRYDVKRISPVEHPDDFFDLMAKKFNHHSGNMYNHTASFMVPNPEYIEEVYNLTISAGEEYTIFVRCMDGNGNANKAEFEIKFCIDDGPDTTPPYIVEPGIADKGFIGHDENDINVTFEISEPDVECKWDRLDLSYGNMKNNMTCGGGYECKAEFTGLISNSITPNEFFIRCKDQARLEYLEDGNRSGDRNTMQTSYHYTLYGSLPLGIKSVSPNNTKLSGPTDEIEVELVVETFAGAENGKSKCYYDNVEFLNTNSIIHKQPGLRFDAAGSPHIIEIKCIDAGGNTAIEKITFEVEEDRQEPTVVRAFYDAGYIRLITDEPAQCAYSTVDCLFNFGSTGITNVTAFNTFDHLVVWNPDSNLYVKCKDKYDRYPIGTCSITLRASDYFGKSSL